MTDRLETLAPKGSAGGCEIPLFGGVAWRGRSAV